MAIFPDHFKIYVLYKLNGWKVELEWQPTPKSRDHNNKPNLQLFKATPPGNLPKEKITYYLILFPSIDYLIHIQYFLNDILKKKNWTEEANSISYRRFADLEKAENYSKYMQMQYLNAKV